LLNQPHSRLILRLCSSQRAELSRPKSLSALSRPASRANGRNHKVLTHGFANPVLRSRAPGWRTDQVSARNKLRRSTTPTLLASTPLASTPPTNPHLDALGSPCSGTCRGFSVCRRENWRHGSRAHRRLPVGPSRIPRDADWRTSGGADTSRAQPSHLCGGGKLLCHMPLSVLLLRLLLSPRLFEATAFEAIGEGEHVRPRLRGPCSSIRIGTIAINGGRRDARYEPVIFRRALRGKQSRTRNWTVLQPRAGDPAHGSI
jgi:hypothetical protein